MKAIKSVKLGQAEVQEVPIPQLRSDYVLVKVEAVALNPSDWKSLDYLSTPGSTCGNDLAGTVMEVGAGVTAQLKKGDHVAAFAHACNSLEPEDGAFADYAVVKGDVAIKLPDSMSFEEGATLGVAVATIGLGLYQKLGLALPDQPTNELHWVFIHGGATAMGTFAVQMAKISGYKIISTSSPRNFDLVKSYGADIVFDYSSPTCAADIHKLTNNTLYHAFDIISKPASAQLCADTLSTNSTAQQPLYSPLLAGPEPFPRDDVTSTFTFAYTCNGEGYKGGDVDIPPSAEDFEFSKRFVKVIEKLLQQEKVRIHPIEPRTGGWQGVIAGIDELRQGNVSAKKLVFRVSEST
ncbi:putative zinc-binding oxidoreductase ToxD [Massariosphaeria phaeospora]|uniref:Putative zinc-binding oxidoreductase ToxD n=1 Tax=Massariosphaeria phaeospora TaxID=100035 RepID=A0A7C8I5E8_9PLEO|nr:putative zinc-binding oxidoreductase ToxD [Massariosphaeria phaeospora]